MADQNPDSDPKPGQGDAQDRGSGKTLPDDPAASKRADDASKQFDDEMLRPKEDRSPLT
jgi:hypothetical protein